VRRVPGVWSPLPPPPPPGRAAPARHYHTAMSREHDFFDQAAGPADS
jgi:hypothetical protein